ncbi:T-cell surface glycoprotein CD8 beta chain-like [Alligator mississippiensis]|uniref:T-cell surface glycoprotein CD8 beta chain-like n=1 Tax=Alligator mississippiensis TaxID=8496 RepID=UPI002877EBA0|nr:T-cell surface glycoprotein CD8 beta chain-like [Alligator mississippiensis]
MSCPLAGILLLALQVAASQEQLWLQQNPAEIWTTSGHTVQMDCTVLYEDSRVSWYKEHQDGSLQCVAQTGKPVPAKGRYSSKVSGAGKTVSLVIRDLQEEDSGLYYCAVNTFTYAGFGNGTRLIISDVAQPSLAILAPSPKEEAELPDPVPLLCLLSPQAQGWGAPLWDLGEGSPGQADSGAQDGEGAWSLTTVPKEKWDTGTCCTCTARQEGTRRNISAAMPKGLGTMSEGT